MQLCIILTETLLNNYRVFMHLLFIGTTLPCAGHSAGAPRVMSIHPSAPSQEKSCRASADTEQLTASRCPSYHCITFTSQPVQR